MSNAESEETLEEFTGKAGVGAVWSVVGYGGRQVIRLVSNLILTRLLLPEHFGLMFIVSGVLIGLALFSDIGLGQAIIQNKRQDPGFLNTVWTINVIRSVVLGLIACVLGPIFARLYDEPMFLTLIPAAGLVAVIGGFTSTRFFTQSRELNVKRIISLEVVAQVVGVIVMIGWALVSPTVWALLAGNIAVELVSVALSHTWLPGIRNRFHFERVAARSLISFGIWIFFSSALTFSADYMDRFLFRAFVDNTLVGVYSIGVTLAAIPSYAMFQVVHSVVFPLYSRLLGSGDQPSRLYRGVRAPILIVAGWATAGLIAGGPTIVRLLYDPRYWEAGWMLQAISAGMWFGVVMSGTNGAAVLALGRTNWTALISLGRVVGIAVCVPIGWAVAGFPGLVFGFAASEFVRYLVSVAGVRRLGLHGVRQDVAMTLLVAVSAAAGWSTVYGLTQVGVSNVVVHAVAVFIVVTAIWAPWHLQLLRRYRRGEKLFSPAD